MSTSKAEPTPGPYYAAGYQVCANTPKGQAELATVHGESEYVARLPADENLRLFVASWDLLAKCEAALAHVSELRDAWQRGALNECDGGGGTRSTRNFDVESGLRAAIAKARWTA